MLLLSALPIVLNSTHLVKVFYDCHIPQTVTWRLMRLEDYENYRSPIFSRLKDHVMDVQVLESAFLQHNIPHLMSRHKLSLKTNLGPKSLNAFAWANQIPKFRIIQYPYTSFGKLIQLEAFYLFTESSLYCSCLPTTQDSFSTYFLIFLDTLSFLVNLQAHETPVIGYWTRIGHEQRQNTLRRNRNSSLLL